MSLSKSIVIVNEFSLKLGNKSGTRGGTPGDYVTRYMARKGATESLTPIKSENSDNYIKRYMLRDSATERLDEVSDIRKTLDNIDGYGGLSFGSFGKKSRPNSSFSDEDVRTISKYIQKGFDNHKKTVFKTVISFDETFLKKHKLIPEDFECHKKGDYKGKVDQGRLRIAIMNGMKKFSRHYDDLAWIGVIQFDTKHIHCHLCMMDSGKGRLYKDGTQIGKIKKEAMHDLRRGIDLELDLSKHIQHMSSHAVLDRQNAKCFIKRFTHKAFELNGAPQLIMAMLPEDKRLWRAHTNNKLMKRADEITRDYVRQIFTYPESGYDKALQSLYDYANARVDREGLSEKEHRNLIKKGKQKIEDDCVNGVYNVLKSVSKKEKKIRTPIIDVMGMDMDDLQNNHDDPIRDFGFKLRSYSSRAKHHKSEKYKYKAAGKTFDNTKAHADAMALKRFYEIEEEYNRKLQQKYLMFLNFMPHSRNIFDDINRLMLQQELFNNLNNMSYDKTLSLLNPEKAERVGKVLYNVDGGSYMVTNPTVIKNRRENARQSVFDLKEQLNSELEDSGHELSEENKIIKNTKYKFDDVKSLDLHHLGYDFPRDIPISMTNIMAFKKETEARYNALSEAVNYLNGSGQGEYISELPVNDIVSMKQVADSFNVSSVLKSKSLKANDGKIVKRHTISLDRSEIRSEIEKSVRETISEIRRELD